jgi:murein L,D-transpeptidase YafK
MLFSLVLALHIASAKSPFSVVLVDKAKFLLHIAEYGNHHLEIKKTFHATTGKATGDKVVEKDLKTPEGVYFFTAKLTPPSLKKKFGAMAIMLNYPNPIDEQQGKTGYDIMLHSTDDPPRLKRNQDSEGCVVVDDDQIKEVSQYIRLGLTPIVIYPELKPEYLSEDYNPKAKEAFEHWLEAWKHKDIDAYIGSYASGFVYNGMNLKKYREYKKSLNDRYAKIEIEAKNVRFYHHPKYSVVTFTQIYESALKGGGQGFKSSGSKTLYFLKTGPSNDDYRIANESYSTIKEE